MFAVVDILGKQYKVTPGEIISVARIPGKVGDSLSFDKVLLTHDKGTTRVGTPTVSGMNVKAKIVKHEKGEKIEVFRFKSKVRYRRHRGFRPQLTILEIVSIG